MSIDPARLYSALLNTGLQQKDNPLYQVIYNLIGTLISIDKKVNPVITPVSNVTNVADIIQHLSIFDEDDDEVWLVPPGIPGGGGTLYSNVQFNSSGVLGGDPRFRWDRSTGSLIIGNSSLTGTPAPLSILLGDGTYTGPGSPIVELEYSSSDPGLGAIFEEEGTWTPSADAAFQFTGMNRISILAGSHTPLNYTGTYDALIVTTSAVVPIALDHWFNFYQRNGTVTKGRHIYLAWPDISSVSEWTSIWSEDLTSFPNLPANVYFLWLDSPGVFRIKGDGVMAYYNPAFLPKYTPGAVDFERVVQQWSGNISQYGLEAGGTGTLRKLRLIGAGLLLQSDILPTINPGVSGQTWNDAGFVRVSGSSGTPSGVPAPGQYLLGDGDDSESSAILLGPGSDTYFRSISLGNTSQILLDLISTQDVITFIVNNNQGVVGSISAVIGVKNLNNAGTSGFSAQDLNGLMQFNMGYNNPGVAGALAPANTCFFGASQATIPLVFVTSGGEAMRILSNKKVSINTTAASPLGAPRLAVVNSDAQEVVNLQNTNDNGACILSFWDTGGTERAFLGLETGIGGMRIATFNAARPMNFYINNNLKMFLDSDGDLNLAQIVDKYNNIATAGWGVPAIYGFGRLTGKTAAQASVATYTVGASDGSFVVSANVNVTTSTLHNFTVTVAYTDETNTAQTLTLNFSQLTGALVTAITNATGVGPYEGVPLHIRCKASTAITIATTGTFTTVTYNVEGLITQMA